jgi:hypothetical protein
MDAGLAGASTFNYNISALTASLPTSLISMSAINLTFDPSILNFNSTQLLLDSVKFNLKLDVTKLLSAGSGAANNNSLFGMIGINMNDIMGMLSAPLTYLANGLSNYSNLNITLSGTSLSGMMSGSVNKGLLELICLNGKPVLTFTIDVV